MSTPLVSLQNVGLEFELDRYRARTLRDVFVEAVSAPLRMVARTLGGGEAEEVDVLDVLRGVNFEARSGERIGLLGVNGAGKTSLCRMIAGIYEPTEGTIKVRGQIRTIFDTAIGILPDLTGRENAELLARFMYTEIEDVQERAALVDEALEFSELGEFVDMPYRTYSNGMQARLCLSLVSARPTDVLILDEVFDGADEFFRAKIATRVLAMIEKSGVVFFVSHSAEQLQRVCNRILLIEDGALIFDGPTDQAIARYRERRTS